MPRPEVLLNCAASLDGKLAAADGSPLRLSDDEDLARVHGMRAACDAILVGIGTVRSDDPSLRVKTHLAQGPDPLRVVLDTRGRTPVEARVLDGSAPSLVVHGEGVERDFGAADAVAVPEAAGRLQLEAVLDVLGARGVRTVLVEGGGQVLRAFLERGCWDRFTLFQAPVLVGGRGPSLWPGGVSRPPFALRSRGSGPYGTGVLWRFEP